MYVSVDCVEKLLQARNTAIDQAINRSIVLLFEAPRQQPHHVDPPSIGSLIHSKAFLPPKGSIGVRHGGLAREELGLEVCVRVEDVVVEIDRPFIVLVARCCAHLHPTIQPSLHPTIHPIPINHANHKDIHRTQPTTILNPSLGVVLLTSSSCSCWWPWPCCWRRLHPWHSLTPTTASRVRRPPSPWFCTDRLAADSVYWSTAEELLEITQGECIAQCDTVYKSEEVCERFCSFVKLFTGPALTEYHKRYIQYNRPRSAVVRRCLDER